MNSVFRNENFIKFVEIILIDDCSSDNSLKKIEKFKKKITLIQNKKRLGLNKSCNKAIKKVKTKYFLRIDSDDFVSKNFLKYFINSLDNDYDLIFSDYCFYRNKKYHNSKIKKFSFQKLISCSVCLKKKKFQEIGGYSNLFWEEYDLYIRYLKKKSSIKFLNKKIYFYRLHKKNMTEKRNWKKKAWKQLQSYHTNKKILSTSKLFLNSIIKE